MSYGKKKRFYPTFQCIMCPFKGKRIDKHLEKIHKKDHMTALLMAKNDKKIQINEEVECTKNLTAQGHADKFLQYFSSLEGGHYIDLELPKNRLIKKQLLNKRISKMVKRILEVFGDKVEISYESLYLLKLIGKPDGAESSVLEKLKENNTWGTVRNHLNALGHFYNYMNACDVQKLTSSQIAALKQSQKGLHRSIWALNKDEMERKKLSDRDKILPIESINIFFKQNVIQELLSFSNNETIF